MNDWDAGLKAQDDRDTSMITKLENYFQQNRLANSSYLRHAQEAQSQDFEVFQSRQEADLRALLPTIVKAEFEPLRDSICAIVCAEFEPLMASLPGIVKAEFEPLKASLDATVVLATATVEAAFDSIRSSFDTSVANLENRATMTLAEFGKRLDALHGSSYVHITKTTLPMMTRRINALEAQILHSQPPPADKVDPSDGNALNANVNDDIALDANDKAKMDATTHSRDAWASARAHGSINPITMGPPCASYGGGTGRGLPRGPVTPNPYRPSTTSHRDHHLLRQTTIPKLLYHGARSAPHPMVHTAHNTASDRHSHVVGGPIVSPRHSNCAIHARMVGASRFDIICLATEEYHLRMDGCDSLMDAILQDCGYATIKAFVDDVAVCYNDIILVHHKVQELWYNAYTHTLGPQVDKILHKSLSVFPKLTTMQMDNVVSFYDRLQEVSMGYSLALMPFDAIALKNCFEGLCPPGLCLA